jgi:hypothetical protein
MNCEEEQVLRVLFINTIHGSFNKELKWYYKALNAFTLKLFTEGGQMTAAQQCLALVYRH